jgi:Leucine-rich repeat (LRR) protein
MKAATYKRYAEHCDLDKEAFLLMYHLIASENPKVEGILPHTLKCNDLDLRCFTAIIQYFPHIEHIQLRRNHVFELEKSLPFLALLPNLKSLVLHENLWKIVNLSAIPTLQSFQVSRHQIGNLEWINSMPNLKHLTIGRTKVDTADFSSIGDRLKKGKVTT